MRESVRTAHWLAAGFGVPYAFYALNLLRLRRWVTKLNDYITNLKDEGSLRTATTVQQAATHSGLSFAMNLHSPTFGPWMTCTLPLLYLFGMERRCHLATLAAGAYFNPSMCFLELNNDEQDQWIENMRVAATRQSLWCENNISGSCFDSRNVDPNTNPRLLLAYFCSEDTKIQSLSVILAAYEGFHAQFFVVIERKAERSSEPECWCARVDKLPIIGTLISLVRPTSGIFSQQTPTILLAHEVWYDDPKCKSIARRLLFSTSNKLDGDIRTLAQIDLRQHSLATFNNPISTVITIPVILPALLLSLFGYLYQSRGKKEPHTKDVEPGTE